MMGGENKIVLVLESRVNAVKGVGRAQGGVVNPVKEDGAGIWGLEFKLAAFKQVKRFF